MSRRLAPRGVRLLGAALLLAPSLINAQLVGVRPERSPFRDIEFRRELTVFTGWYATDAGIAGVLPRGGPMLGARWETHLSGPLRFYTRVGSVFSQRTVINPARPDSLDASGNNVRSLGEYGWPVFFGDVGLNADLTGRKSYRRLVPMLSVGVGGVTDFIRGPDAGQFSFGTKFALSYGGGVRYVPDGRWQYRLDVHDVLHRVKYPPSYLTNLSGSGPVIADPQEDRSWHHNVALQFGVSWTYGR